MNFSEIKEILNPKQQAIYNGLKEIGNEISAFYYDAVYIIKDTRIGTKSYIIGHLAREINSGLIGAFAKKINRHDDKTSILKYCLDNYEKLSKEEFIKGIEGCFKDENIKSLISSIFKDAEKTELIKKWHKLAKKFPTMAHRHGIWKEPRSFDNMLNLWNEYENILFEILGGYYRLLQRIDRILLEEKPSKEVVNIIKNLLKSPARYQYFFSKLSSKEWFIPLKEIGFFKPENNPEPYESENAGYYLVPYWWEIIYLEKISKQLNNRLKKEYIKTIEGIAAYRKIDGSRIINFRTDHIIVNILFQLPADEIRDEYFSILKEILSSSMDQTLISGEIEKLISKYIDYGEKRLICSLLREILEYRKISKGNKYTAFCSVIGDYWLKKALSENAKNSISLICPHEVIGICINIIEKLLKDGNVYLLSYGWMTTVEESFQNSFPEKYEYIVVSLLRDTLINASVEIANDYIKKSLSKSLSIFRRIAFYTINVHYPTAKEFFWSLEENPLKDIDTKHEIYELLKAHCLEFSNAEIEKLLQWIEYSEYSIQNEIDPVSAEKYLAYKRKEWLWSVIANGNERINVLYKKYSTISTEELDHPGLNAWHDSQIGVISPLSKEQIFKMSHHSLFEYLISYKEEIGWKKPTIRGLQDTFESAIAENPRFFIEALEHYKNLPFHFKGSLLSGFCLAMENESSFMHYEILKYITNDINILSNPKEKNENNYYLYSISIYIKKIFYFNQVLEIESEIIFNILEFMISNVNSDTDFIDSASVRYQSVNSFEGNVWEIIILFSIWSVNRGTEQKITKWDYRLRDIIQKNLNFSRNRSLIFSSIIGRSIRNLFYIDDLWINENIDVLFLKGDVLHWETVFTSYILSENKYYMEIYVLLKKSSQINYALQFQFKDNNTGRLLSQMIGIAILNGWEDLEILTDIMNSKNNYMIDYMIDCFSNLLNHQYDSFDSEGKETIRAIWILIYTYYSKMDQVNSSRRIFRSLVSFMPFLEAIDSDLKGMLSNCIQNMQWVSGSESFFLENLALLSSSLPSVALEFLRDLLDTGVFPLYKQEYLEKVLQNAYLVGLKEEADFICNYYGEHGYDNLRDLYESQNKG